MSANQVGCLNLLTNAVIVWNTVYMQAALDAIRREGYPVEEEDLTHLWPIRFAPSSLTLAEGPARNNSAERMRRFGGLEDGGDLPRRDRPR